MNHMNMRYSFFIFSISRLLFSDSDSVDTLKKIADRDFLWLLIATGLVAIGLVFEVGEVCQELKRWWKARGRKRSWVPIISAVGFLLVTIGVVGEGIFEGKLGIVDTSIREKDEKAAQDAGDAAGRAQQSAQRAAADAIQAKDSADLANKEAGKAQQKAGIVAKQAEELNRKLVAATIKLEAVDAKRAELETSLKNLAVCTAPRVLPFWSSTGGPGTPKKTDSDPLKPFAKYKADIEVVPDTEARRAALNIASALQRAGCGSITLTVTDGIRDGVEVQPFLPSLDESSLVNARMNSREAAEAIIKFLRSYNWQAEIAPPVDEKGNVIHYPKTSATDVLRIRVGLYPPIMFVAPPAMKAFADATQEIKRQEQEMRKKMEEEYLKRLTPQEILEWKKHNEEYNNRVNRISEGDSNPCRPLTPLFP